MENYGMMRKTIFYILCFLAVVGSINAQEIDWLGRLKSVNTMVGTDMANTKTAGLFGKGSEEHGQTLPAVLVPNGQNFWTPQTQDTEQKCIAPYYYKDNMFQGFRNSHWIVGGCTQDYGSFTVAVISDSLRLQPAERATRFSHNEEESHPYYYGIRLPDEHLKAEITGLSHSAIIRVTPEKDETIYIVVNPNSDEGQGYIEIDTINHLVYGYNPVHRIYQGWGEPAGFSGHFVLEANFADNIILQDGIAALAFKAKAHQPMEFAMASSFTSKEGALNNLRTEIGGNSFDGLEVQCINKWIERFKTITVEDPDEARVNQFYGAFYRASFLPREMSDCDGAYPTFANNSSSPIGGSGDRGFISSPKGEESKGQRGSYFDDFSMWDIYRAVLPLYNIITPTLSGNMMNSLVKKYEQGGWLPIFPCWNSYTAAMIGDHASVALADAYIKGIRGFDEEKAYEAMRKNAFETPVTFEEYKNGMGRRALESYLKYGYIPMEDGVKEAFHNDEQTSRTLEYAFDDFAVAQMAKALGKASDYDALIKRSENWRNVINPLTGYADGRHADGSWENNTDQIHRKSYITEGATCHYTWYVPQNIEGLMEYMPNGREGFITRLDSMFTEGRYWHGNEPCHQVAYLYDYVGEPWKTQKYVRQILDTEYNDTPGGLSGNDDAGQMSAWYMFSALGFYPVCPATTEYAIGSPTFQKVTFNLENGKQFIIEAEKASNDNIYIQKATLNGKRLKGNFLDHKTITGGGTLKFQMSPKH